MQKHPRPFWGSNSWTYACEMANGANGCANESVNGWLTNGSNECANGSNEWANGANKFNNGCANGCANWWLTDG